MLGYICLNFSLSADSLISTWSTGQLIGIFLKLKQFDLWYELRDVKAIYTVHTLYK